MFSFESSLWVQYWSFFYIRDEQPMTTRECKYEVIILLLLALCVKVLCIIKFQAETATRYFAKFSLIDIYHQWYKKNTVPPSLSYCWCTWKLAWKCGIRNWKNLNSDVFISNQCYSDMQDMALNPLCTSNSGGVNALAIEYYRITVILIHKV